MFLTGLFDNPVALAAQIGEIGFEEHNFHCNDDDGHTSSCELMYDLYTRINLALDQTPPPAPIELGAF